MLELVNVMEQAVTNMTDSVIEEEKLCGCERCRLDIIALALNSLPPKYVVSQQGRAFETFRLEGVAQGRVAVYQAVLEAAHMVRDNPRHGNYTIK